MTRDLSDTTRLSPGQSLRIAADAGTSLCVIEGCVRIVSPSSWFGETVFTATHTLHEGEVHVVERGGWIEVAALAPVRLRGLSQPAPAGSSRVARLVQLLLAA